MKIETIRYRALLNIYKDDPIKTLDLKEKYEESKRKYNTDRNKKWRLTESGSEITKKSLKKYFSSHKYRQNAWNATRKIPQQPCEVCGKLPTHKHHEDVSKPLDIVFLCPFHHKIADKNLKNRLNLNKETK